MLKQIAFASLGILLLTSPVLASADQISDLQAQVQALIAQIAQLTHTSPSNDNESAGGSGQMQCPNLTLTLSVGSTDATTGGQVSQLQGFLTDYLNINEDIVTGYFGVKTARYVKQFQAQQGIDQVGWVGRLTRAAIARVCGGTGQGTPTNFTATPALGTAPLTVNFSYPFSQDKYAPSVGFGDGTPMNSQMSCSRNGCTLTHTYAYPGTYKAILVGSSENDLGTQTITVTNAPTGQGTITVTYPQAGYSLYNGLAKGDGTPATNPIATIRWTSSNTGSDAVGIALFYASGPMNGQLVKYIGQKIPDTGSYVWQYDPTLQSGSYSISIYAYQGVTPTSNVGGGSSGVFQITSSPSQQPIITSTATNIGDANNFEVYAGREVVIQGTNLATPDTTKVFIGGLQATVVWTSGTTVRAVVPSALMAGQTVDLWITNDYGTSNIVRVKVLGTMSTPVTFTATPTNGPAPLQNVQFAAMNLNPSKTYGVTYGDGAIDTIPPRPTSTCTDYPSYPCPSTWSWHAPHTYNIAGTYTATLKDSSGIVVGTQTISAFDQGPTITYISSTTGFAGTKVWVYGTNFASVMTALFGDSTLPVTLSSDFSFLTFIVPLTTPAGTYGLRVANTHLSTGPYYSNTVNFTVTGAAIPVISSLSPTSGPIGTSLTITGSGFTPTGNQLWCMSGCTYSPGVIPNATSLSSTNGTTITYTIPKTPVGAYTLAVVNANGTSNTMTFTVTGIIPL